MVKCIHRSMWADLENIKSVAWGLQEPTEPLPCCPFPPGQLSPCLGRTGTGGPGVAGQGQGDKSGSRLSTRSKSVSAGARHGPCCSWARLRVMAAGGSHAGRWWLVGDAWGPGSSVAMWESRSTAPTGEAGISRETCKQGSCMFLPCVRPERWQVLGK